MSDSSSACFKILAMVGALLIVILVPLSFSYIDYWEYGLIQRKSTGSVSLDEVFGQGRHFLGPDYRFIEYQADAHAASMDGLNVFSAGATNSSIGLEFEVDIYYTYLPRSDKIAQVHQEMALSYGSVIHSRAIEGIRNQAIFISFDQYFSDRKTVEQLFRDAVQRSWDATPSVHADLDQFHLGRIEIPDTVAERQLESRVQNERNDKEGFLQQAQLERDQTAVEVNKINLDSSKILETADAEASLVRGRALASARKITTGALNEGTKGLLATAGIVNNEEQVIALAYIRTLSDHNNLDLRVSYISDGDVVRTTPAL